MTVKVLGVADVSDDSIGIHGESQDELGAEIDELALLEFLAADLDPVPADPAFKRSLGELLWGMVRDRRSSEPSKL
jgi:hypothetical protein